MDVTTFTNILDKVSPLITKRDTHMRRAIPASERLALTLRYLATGRILLYNVCYVFLIVI